MQRTVRHERGVRDSAGGRALVEAQAIDFLAGADEIQQKDAPLTVDTGAGTSGDGFPQGLRLRGLRIPGNTVGEVRRMPRRQGLRRTPKSHDIVIALAPRRNFDQFDGARAPLAPGFDPGAGPTLILRVEILKIALLPGPLHQSEASRRLRREGGSLEFGRIRELPKYVFAGLHIN